MINTLNFFDGIFKHAVENSILILDIKGTILDVNKGFINAFGYKKNELIGKNFEFLFTEVDREANKPAIEIKTALAKGNKSDNNYLLNREGLPIWVLGESVAVENKDGEKYVVKIIQNLNTQKKLEGFLIESDEFIHTIFDSVKDTAFAILSSDLRVLRINKIFSKLFNLAKKDILGVKLSKLENDFWKSAEIKKEITNVLVTRSVMKNVSFNYINSLGKTKQLLITSKLMQHEQTGKTILLVISVK
ncbi:MAG: PAS domain-containing protein [Ferruginibacter sp.]|nr:PAS domain-containing protein [Ferruginibacter sp.]